MPIAYHLTRRGCHQLKGSESPYILRGLVDWIIGEGFSPHIIIDTTAEGLIIPENHGKNSQITLNISPTAVKSFSIFDNYISFHARFSGVSEAVKVPINSIQVIFAKENGSGAILKNHDRITIMQPDMVAEELNDPPSSAKKEKPTLRIVD